jgi:hypothetical protein
VIEPRIYRAAFVPAVLALLLVMFSLQSQPSGLPQALAADVLFDARRANEDLRDIVRTSPDRRPGKAGDQATARRVADELAGLGLRTVIDRYRAEGRDLTNVVARRGGGESAVVVMAARDADSVPDATSSAADTAALVELARVFENKVANKTIVFASVDGSTLGDAGARRLANQLEDGPQIDAVLVLSHLGAAQADGPMLLAWSNDSHRGGIGLARTATASLRQELEDVPGDPGAVEQLTRLAFPLGLGGQGPLLARGIDAIRLSGSGELPPASGEQPEDVDVERYAQLGKGALRTIFALEEGKRPEHGPSSYVIFAGQVVPGWGLSLLTLCLILPGLVASVDAFARARRRRQAVAPYWRWLGATVLAFLAALGVGELLVLIGQAPNPPPGPPAPTEVDIDGTAAAALIATSFTAALGLVLAWTRVLRRPGWPPPADAPAAGCAVSLAFAFALLVVWALNPFTALLLVPALHLWMVASLTRVRARAAAGLAVAGLLPPLIAVLIYMGRLDLGPLEAPWYAFQLVTGGHVGVLPALVGCVLLGIGASVLAIVAARRRVPEPAERARAQPPGEPQPIFGPGGHAGPGMLGGPTGARRR